jgi:hypothetical protein
MDFFSSFKTPGSALDSKGNYTYVEPENGSVQKVPYLFGWLYYRTPFLLLGLAVVVFGILFIGLGIDFRRQRRNNQKGKAIKTGEVMYSAKAAKRREIANYNNMSTKELRKAKQDVHNQRDLAESRAKQAEEAFVSLSEYTPDASTNEVPDTLRNQLQSFSLSATLEPNTKDILNEDVLRRRLMAIHQKESQIVKDRTEDLNEMPPIYEPVKPRFWGAYVEK